MPTTLTKPPTPAQLKTAAEAGELAAVLDDGRFTDGLSLREAFRERGGPGDLRGAVVAAGIGSEQHLAALREVEAERPDDRVLGFVAGAVAQEVRRRAAQPTAKAMAAARQATLEAREQYESDRGLGDLPPGAFEDFVADKLDDQCPGRRDEDGERTTAPHGIRGRIERSGTKWRCRVCDFESDALPLWRKHQEAANA